MSSWAHATKRVASTGSQWRCKFIGGNATNGPVRMNDLLCSLTVQVVPVASLKLYARNPRTHSPRQIRQIARGIETFGFNVPVLVDAKRNVIAGHGRIMAVQLLGWKQVPTIRLEHLSDAQARAFMIADNRLTENSAWDDRLLAENLKELSTLSLDFSLEVTGFEMGEIDFRIEGLTLGSESEEDPADAVPAAREGPHVSRVGDLWRLGQSRVYCGSALDLAAYTALMQQEKAAVVITDPPYNVRIEGNVSGLGAIHHREFLMASGEMNEPEFTAFLSKACSLLAHYTVDGSLHYVFMDWRHIPELLAAGRKVYSELKNICVWVKNNAGMGSLYRSQHEFVFIFKHGRESHRNNIQLGQHGRHRSNVWHYPGVRSFAKAIEEDNLLALHPTVKPVALVADALMDCSARGEIVLDVFLGSGTTVIAAERTGRRCYGLEIDPVYVDLAIRRFQNFTGEDVIHVKTGLTFAEMQRERSERGG